MSNAIDDKELDEYLSGGTQYSQRYRSIPADSVPVEIDQFVLAQANSDNVTSITGAIEKRSPRIKSLAFWMRVSAPVALAASIVLVVSLMIDSGVRNNSAPATANLPMADSAKPASPEASEPQPIASNSAREYSPLEPSQEKKTEELARRDRQAASKSASDSFSESVATAAVATPVAKEAERKQEASAGAAALAPASATPIAADKRATTELDSVVVTGTFRKYSPEDAAMPVEVISSEQLNAAQANSKAGPRETISQSAFAKQKITDRQLTKQLREADPDAWLAYIRELRSTGKLREADEEWKRFLKAYPNYAVDESDSARPKK